MRAVLVRPLGTRLSVPTDPAQFFLRLDSSICRATLRAHEPPPMIIGTAGHVDHGKTALVKALTGVDTDRLAEEKRRGITIDLGYAYAGDVAFVDVPGHERFVHTMLAGASGIDTALLVVALPEGIRPQTREHLNILSLLGIDRVVIALTKADLAPDRVPEVSAALRALLAESARPKSARPESACPETVRPDCDGPKSAGPESAAYECVLAEAPMVPVSALTGQGIDDLRAALLASARPLREANGYPRLAVDRAFTLPGVGLITTGTLVSGRIAVEDRLVLSPSGLELRVRGLHAQNKPAREAVAGQRVALNITGPKLSRDVVARGDWVVHPDVHAPTTSLDARITLLPDVARALQQNHHVHLHLGAAHLMARVSLLDREALRPGEEALIRLTLPRPIGALARDRIVLRDTGGTCTIGGGVALDPFPPRRGRRTSLRLAQLHALEAEDPVDALRRVLAAAPGWTDQSAFMCARNVLQAGRPALISAVPAVAAGGLVLSPDAFNAVRASVLAVLGAHHRSSPELPGLQIDRLRLALRDRPPILGFAGILEALLRDGGLARDGPWFRLPGHRISLSPLDEKLWRAARPLIAAEPFRPPRTRTIAEALKLSEAATRATLKRLTRMGQLIEIAPDHFFLSEVVSRMAVIAADVVDEDGLLTAAAFRDRLGNGRKVAILILEFFDKAGLTVRQGDARRVRTDRVGMFGRPEID
jgi:selenocysteine-specific elongation factor